MAKEKLTDQSIIDHGRLRYRIEHRASDNKYWIFQLISFPIPHWYFRGKRDTKEEAISAIKSVVIT
jgi:hypothetical protein